MCVTHYCQSPGSGCVSSSGDQHFADGGDLHRPASISVGAGDECRVERPARPTGIEDQLGADRSCNDAPAWPCGQQEIAYHAFQLSYHLG